MTTTTSERPFTCRRALVLAAGLASALILAACGGDSPSDDQAAPAAGSDAAGTYPVTIDQAAGEVTIDEEPRRVVSLDFPSADAAIALGVVPVGMTELSYVEGGIQERTRTALDGEEPELVPTDDGYPFETPARLDPMSSSPRTPTR